MFVRHHETPGSQLIGAVLRGLGGLHHGVPGNLPLGPGPVLPHSGVERHLGVLQAGQLVGLVSLMSSLSCLLLQLTQDDLRLLLQLQEILLGELRFLQ